MSRSYAPISTIVGLCSVQRMGVIVLYWLRDRRSAVIATSADQGERGNS